MGNQIKLMLLTFVLFLFTGCGIKDEIKQKEIDLTKRIENLKENVSKEEEKVLNSELGKKYKNYIEQEKMFSKIGEAKTVLNTINEEHKTLKEIIKKDNSDDNATAYTKIINIQNAILEVNKKYQYPMERLKLLDILEKDLPKTIENINNAKIKYNNENQETLNMINEALKKHENKKDNITNKITILNELSTKINKEYDTFLEETNKETKNLSKVDKTKETFENLIKAFNGTKTIFEKENKELNVSYTKILTDMNEKHYIIIGRVSWDENSDWDRENSYSYTKVEIPAEVLDNYDNLEDTIATYSKGLFSNGLSISMNKTDWEFLRIDPTKDMSSSDTDAEFFIEDIRSVYYHKYTIIENDKKTEKDFEVVSAEIYEKHINDLGMSLITKPYGYYETDSIKTSTPAGLSFVGNPNYGQWKTDNNGISFFEFYGMYSMFNDLVGNNGRYTRNDYDRYNERDRNNSYYGGGYYGTYGSSTMNNPRYQNSTFNKTVNRGSDTMRNSSVRTSGTESRGRGPGGGGK